MAICVVRPHENVILVSAGAEHELVVKQVLAHIAFRRLDKFLGIEADEIYARLLLTSCIARKHLANHANSLSRIPSALIPR